MYPNSSRILLLDQSAWFSTLIHSLMKFFKVWVDDTAPNLSFDKQSDLLQEVMITYELQFDL